MQKYVISVSKKNNSVWKIYFYDENFQIHSERINPLLIWYYKLRKRHRKTGVCPQCSNQFLFLTNWHDKKMNCPICLDEEEEDNITVDENENEDSLGKIVSSALIGLIGMKLKQYTKN